jgi:hypothetical protein
MMGARLGWCCGIRPHLGLATGMAALEENMGIGADIGEWQQRQLCAVWSCEVMVLKGYCCRVPYIE